MRKLPLGILIAALITGCTFGGDSPTGELSLTVYGEEFIEEGIPTDFFTDDWSVEFDSFLVVVGRVGNGLGGAEKIFVEDYRVFDLTENSNGEGHLLETVEASTGVYDRVTFEIAGLGRPEATAGNATSSDIARMNDNDYAVFVSGTATKGDVTKTFEWGFKETTRYSDCTGTTELEADGSATTELTIHADHLFHSDTLVNDPELAFDAIADADTAGDGDGNVTLAELGAVDITGFEKYNSDGAADDLETYISLLVSSIGHVDGEPHCEQVVIDP